MKERSSLDLGGLLSGHTKATVFEHRALEAKGLRMRFDRFRPEDEYG
jgi:hypothetical protein